MSRLPPVPPAGRPTRGPDAVPKTFEDVTHRVRHQAQRLERRVEDVRSSAQAPPSGAPSQGEASLIAGVSRPMLDLAIAGFAGYVLGYLTARR